MSILTSVGPGVRRRTVVAARGEFALVAPNALAVKDFEVVEDFCAGGVKVA